MTKDRRATDQEDNVLTPRVMAGLLLGGIGCKILTTIFSVFSTDVFLNIYKLPMPIYASGNLIFSFINTANDLGGAWLVDSMGSTNKKDVIGISGCLFALCFLTPFVPFLASWWQGGVHFVTSLSLYDTMYSFMAILIESVISENSRLTDEQRIRFMRNTKIANLSISLVLVRIALGVFPKTTTEDEDNNNNGNDSSNDKTTETTTRDMTRFRYFVLILAFLVSILFLVAQFLITTGNNHQHSKKKDDFGHNDHRNSNNWCKTKTTSVRGFYHYYYRKLFLQQHQQQTNTAANHESRSTLDNRNDDDNDRKKQQQQQRKKKKLQIKKVVKDFWDYKNFRAWIGMEMLLECQSNFMNSFLKIFMDRLVVATNVVDRSTCYWILSVIAPLRQIVAIALFVPIQRYGYQKLYSCMFLWNIVLSFTCYLVFVGGVGSSSSSSSSLLLLSSTTTNNNYVTENDRNDFDDNNISTFFILSFLVLSPVITGAVQSCGFGLAMADMVLEMKMKHIEQGGFDEPTLAGLFMGANALLCKPMDALLPVVAAIFLKQSDESSSSSSSSSSSRFVLFHLMVLPSLVFSCLQLASWSMYTLTPARTSQLRKELNHHKQEQVSLSNYDNKNSNNSNTETDKDVNDGLDM